MKSAFDIAILTALFLHEDSESFTAKDIKHTCEANSAEKMPADGYGQTMRAIGNYYKPHLFVISGLQKGWRLKNDEECFNYSFEHREYKSTYRRPWRG